MKPKIAFVIGKLSSGGAERVISTLSNFLINTYDITIITTVNAKPFYSLDKGIKHISCFQNEIIPPSKSLIQSLKLNYTISKRIASIIKDEKIDLIIGFITQTNIFSIIAAKKNQIPCIISERTNPYHDKLPKFWKLLRVLLYPRANCLVLQTKKAQDFYSSFIKKGKLRILPNPISPNLTNKREYINRKNIVLNVGRLHWIKNQKLLINAFSSVNNPNWELIILGEGEEKDALMELVNSKNCENIHLLGNKDNVQDYYNNAKIFVFTSFFEGFPNALIEAMHFGLAPISTDCPSGPSELITNEKNGLLIPIDDQKALEKKLLKLMDNPHLVKTMGDEAQISTEKLKAENVAFLWEKLISSYLQ